MQDFLETTWTFYNKSGSITDYEVSTIYECLDCGLQFIKQRTCPECERKRNQYTTKDRRITVISKDFPIAKLSLSKDQAGKIFKRYWVLFETRTLYDPYIKQINYDKRNWKFKSVSESVFNLYLEYLGHGSKLNKNKYYIKTKAERMVK